VAATATHVLFSKQKTTNEQENKGTPEKSRGDPDDILKKKR
jgi:hypothetical protein